MRDYYAQRLAEARRILGGKCRACGTTENLQFDHIDPRQKLYAISKMLMWAKARWLKELEKCQLLCRKHHDDKTRSDVALGLVKLGPRS